MEKWSGWFYALITVSMIAGGYASITTSNFYDSNSQRNQPPGIHRNLPQTGSLDSIPQMDSVLTTYEDRTLLYYPPRSEGLDKILTSLKDRI